MRFLFTAFAAFVLSACTPNSRDITTAAVGPDAQKAKPQFIKSDYAPGEIQGQCDAAISNLNKSLDELARTEVDQRKNFDATILKFENILANFNDKVQPLTFMGYVSTDENLRNEGSECEVKVGTVYVDLTTRKDLYNALKDAQAEEGNADQMRLLSETLLGFKKNGLMLSDEKLAEVKKLKTELTELESNFSKNLNEDKTTLLFTQAELAGTPEAFLKRLKVDSATGQYIVTTKNSDYLQVMENATLAATRKRMLSAYLQRGGKANTDLLNKAVGVRRNIAAIMGYANWADYRIQGRMAETSEKALELLNGLKGKLAERTKEDVALLLESKKKFEGPNAGPIEAWDISFYANQVKKEKFSIDDEEIRQYFPKETVVSGLFQVYSTLFGVTFEQVAGAQVWHPDVKLYSIRYKDTGATVGYFYTDLFPREGKYGHAAAFPLIAGRVLDGGNYSMPIASIVANFEPPSADRPSLLSHDEVETLFHEFGHIMHQTLTRARYASLSGSNVANDYVEAPSQMLENWVWTPEILNMVSGLYTDTNKKLPAELIGKMLAAKNFNQGYFYSRQLVLGLTDLSIHTSTDATVDVDATYNKNYQEILGIAPLEGNHFMGTFGHMMGGYDAGYYGYIWSEVYAQDMWSLFKGNPLNEEMGMKYRKTILEQGSMRPALDLIEELLGRPLSFDAFYEKLGIK